MAAEQREKDLEPSLACPSSKEMLAKASESKFCFQSLVSNLVMNEAPQEFMDCTGSKTTSSFFMMIDYGYLEAGAYFTLCFVYGADCSEKGNSANCTKLLRSCLVSPFSLHVVSK